MDELLEMIGIGRIIRFAINMFNFKKLSLWGKIRAVLFSGVAVFAALKVFLVGSIEIEDFQLTPVDHMVLSSCTENYVKNDMEFTAYVDVEVGCACSAKAITAAVEPEHIETFMTAHDIMLAYYAAEYVATSQKQYDALEAEIVKQIRTEAVTANMTREDYEAEYVDMAYEIDLVCDDSGTYSSDNVAKLAALTSIGYEPSVTVNLVKNDDGTLQSAELRGPSSLF